MPKPRWILLAKLAAALLLTMSITMLTDFTHRLLSADPDTLGIIAIATQALLALVASSSFTTEGWSLLPERLSRMQKTDEGNARLRLYLSGALFIIVALTWYFALPLLSHVYSQYYNARGYNLPQDAPAVETMRDYRRAIALDPTQEYAYYNLGETLESFYRYDDAVEQYEKAIAANPSDPLPYNNLARLLLLGGKPNTALQIASDGLALSSLSQSSLDDLRKKSTDTRRTAFFASTDARNRQTANQQLTQYLAAIEALHKNRAEAELDLGFYQAAITDANQSGTAAAQCILGQTYAKLGQTANAQTAWTKFKQIMQTPATSASAAPVVQPSCLLLAEEQNEKH
jgi:tetratricopeptide (TPR) repeat protein